MTSHDRDTLRSLAEMEGNESLEPLSPPEGAKSSVSTGCEALFQKPIADLSIEDIRLLLSQDIGIRFLIPLAIEHLRNNAFAQCAYYPGDLLSAVMRIPPEFWAKHEETYWEVSEIASGLLPTLKKLEEEIQKFQERIGQQEIS